MVLVDGIEVSENNDIQTMLELNTKTLDEHSKKISFLQNEQTIHEKKLNSQKSYILNLGNAINNQLSDVNIMTNKTDGIESSINSIITTFNNYKIRFSDLEANDTHLENQIITHKKQITNIEETINMYQSKISNFDNVIIDINNTQTLNSENISICTETRYISLENMNISNETRITNLETINIKLESRFIEQFEDTNNRLESQLADTNNRLESQLADTNNRLAEQLADTNNRLESQLVDTNNRLELRLVEQLEDTNNRLELRLVEQLEDTNNRLELRLVEQLEYTNNRLELRLVEQLEYTNNRLESRLAEQLEDTNNKLELRLAEQLADTNNRLAEQLEDTNNRLAEQLADTNNRFTEQFENINIKNELQINKIIEKLKLSDDINPLYFNINNPYILLNDMFIYIFQEAFSNNKLINTSRGWRSNNLNCIEIKKDILDRTSIFTIPKIENLNIQTFYKTSILNNATFINKDILYTLPQNSAVDGLNLVDSVSNLLIYDIEESNEMFLSTSLLSDIYFEYNNNLYIYYYSSDVMITNHILESSNNGEKLFNLVYNSDNVTIISISGSKNIFTLDSNEITVKASTNIKYDLTNDLNNRYKFTVKYQLISNSLILNRTFIVYTHEKVINYKYPITYTDMNKKLFNEVENNDGFANIIQGITSPILLNIYRDWFYKTVNGDKQIIQTFITNTDILDFVNILLKYDCILNQFLLRIRIMLNANFASSSSLNAKKYSSIITYVPLEIEALNNENNLQKLVDFLRYATLILNSTFINFSSDEEKHSIYKFIEVISDLFNKLIYISSINISSSVEYKLNVISQLANILKDRSDDFNIGQSTAIKVAQRHLVPIKLIDIDPSSITRTGIISIPVSTILSSGQTNKLILTIKDGKGNNGLKFRYSSNCIISGPNPLIYNITSKKYEINYYNLSLSDGAYFTIEVINQDYDYFGCKILFTTDGNPIITTGFTYIYFTLPLFDQSGKKFIDLKNVSGNNDEIYMKIKSCESI